MIHGKKLNLDNATRLKLTNERLEQQFKKNQNDSK